MHLFNWCVRNTASSSSSSRYDCITLGNLADSIARPYVWFPMWMIDGFDHPQNLMSCKLRTSRSCVYGIAHLYERTFMTHCTDLDIWYSLLCFFSLLFLCLIFLPVDELHAVHTVWDPEWRSEWVAPSAFIANWWTELSQWHWMSGTNPF